jgi:hypothetical protein
MTTDNAAMRFTIGPLLLLAAIAVLIVSMVMNFRFGHSLGKTEFDALIYGAASVAADGFKALSPFVFFAALRSRAWAVAVAAFFVWIVTTGYALTGALGHSLLNRVETTGARVLAQEQHKDLRSDLKRNMDQLSWIPPHRAAEAVKGDIEAHRSKNMLLWSYSEECVRPEGKGQREFCAAYHKLRAELGNAESAAKLNVAIDGIRKKLAESKSESTMTEADPQAGTIAKVFGIPLERVQFAFAIGIVLLLEFGSGLGPYISLSYMFAFGRVREKIIKPDYPNEPQQPIVTEPAQDMALGLPPPSQPLTAAEIIIPEPPPSGAPPHVARLPLPGSLPSLDAIGFPIHERPAKRRDKSQPREAAERFVVWLRAFDLVREPLTDEDVTTLYAEFCEADYRQPTAENLLKGELKNLKGVTWSKPRTDGDDGKVKRQTRWLITRGKYPPPTPQKEGVILAYPRPLAVPAREPEQMRLAA